MQYDNRHNQTNYGCFGTVLDFGAAIAYIAGRTERVNTCLDIGSRKGWEWLEK